MKKILLFLGNLVGGVLLLALLIMVARLTGWSFGNLFFGPQYEGVPAIRSVPREGQIIASFRQKAWWIAEYKTLNAALDSAGGNLACAYRSGPGGATTVNLEMRRGPGAGLTLIIDTPPEATKSLEEHTGRLIPHDYRTVFSFRDNDLDGMPDESRMEPAGKPLYAETVTPDGYTRVRDSVDHTADFALWAIGMGMATNRFLHGSESSLPLSLTWAPPEEIELEKLKKHWESLGEEEQERERFFDALLDVYDAGQWLSKESVDWCTKVLDQGVKEEHIFELILPRDLREEVLTEAEFLELGRQKLARRIDIYGGVKAFLNRQELTLGSFEKIAADKPELTWLSEFCKARRRLILSFHDGRIDEKTAGEQIIAAPIEMKLAIMQMTEDEPSAIYISALNLQGVVAGGE